MRSPPCGSSANPDQTSNRLCCNKARSASGLRWNRGRSVSTVRKGIVNDIRPKEPEAHGHRGHFERSLPPIFGQPESNQQDNFSIFWYNSQILSFPLIFRLRPTEFSQKSPVDSHAGVVLDAYSHFPGPFKCPCTDPALGRPRTEVAERQLTPGR